MSETLLCILLVSSSAKGSNLIYHWPPSPQTTPRLARPLPADDFPGALADNPWRAANSSDNPTEDPHWDMSALDLDDTSEYYWQRPRTRQTRTVSFSHPPSHPTSRRASPSKDGAPSDDSPHLGVGGGRGLDEYDTLLGYSTEFLAQILCPQSSMCHQKFELIVDDLAFIGHPVCADSDGGWRFKQDREKGRVTGERGRGPKKQSSQDEERLLTPERMERGERDGRILVLKTGNSGMQTFHFVVVLDLPDPSSSASGNIAKYFDTIYRQIAFNVTAVLYQEQVVTQFVESECDVLGSLKEDYANKGESFADFMYKALEISTIAVAMKTLYESIKQNTIASITLHGLPLELQLPPYLDTLLHADEDLEPEDEGDGEPNAWGPEMSFAWRLPALTPWKALLRLDDENDEGYELYMQLRAAQLNPDERELAEQLLRFLDLASVMLQLADMATLLDWNLESQVYPAVRWLVLHRRAKVVDVVHPSLKTVFSVPPQFPSPLAVLSEEFARTFAERGVPSLPKLLAMISTAAQKQTANHFYATVVREKDYIQTYLSVVLWMLKRDLLIRLHLRIRIIAPAALKQHTRKCWEEHVMRKRSRPRAHSIDINSSRERASRGRSGRSQSMDDEKDVRLETVSESSPVENWMSLSPKTARKQTRQRSSDGGKQELRQDDDEEKLDGGKEDELDEEFLSSSADEEKWTDYYQSGGSDEIASIISDPARATPLERRWLARMSEGKSPDIVQRFERIHQYFDGKCSDDEILYSADISRKQLREVLHHYEEYLQTFLHPS